MSEELLSRASQRAAVAAMATGQCAIAKDAIQIITAVKLGQPQKPIFIRPRHPLSIPGSVVRRNLCVLWKLWSGNMAAYVASICKAWSGFHENIACKSCASWFWFHQDKFREGVLNSCSWSACPHGRGQPWILEFDVILLLLSGKWWHQMP